MANTTHRWDLPCPWCKGRVHHVLGCPSPPLSDGRWDHMRPDSAEVRAEKAEAECVELRAKLAELVKISPVIKPEHIIYDDSHMRDGDCSEVIEFADCEARDRAVSILRAHAATVTTPIPSEPQSSAPAEPTAPEPPKGPRTPKLAEVLSAAKRAEGRVLRWPKWKRDIGLTPQQIKEMDRAAANIALPAEPEPPSALEMVVFLASHAHAGNASMLRAGYEGRYKVTDCKTKESLACYRVGAHLRMVCKPAATKE